MRFFIRLFFRTLRTILGPYLLAWNWITQPRSIQRSTEQQQQVDEKTRNLTLYQFKTCPFCIKVRRSMKQLALNIELRDAQHNQQHRQELLEGGGEVQTPCLKIVHDDGRIEWMYESSDIVSFLQKSFA
ncbi:MAG: glutathione S-transferase N-terminal domain-containing protein [Gammaproteobacteria bacterium]|nr:glutathione S-transferase N-terminal domain-containing protein [Gammaproteobacteria bacterium]